MELSPIKFPDAKAKYDFAALETITDSNPSVLAENLWEEVWGGRISNDSFSALRRGLQQNFKIPEIPEDKKKTDRYTRRRSGRIQLSQWKGSQSYPGNWFLFPEIENGPEKDLIEIEERKKDRVRLLLDRYGILFRELLHREQAPFRWRDIFRTLRLMELSGEILAGYFFKDIPGPQFISHHAFRLLQEKRSEDAVYWINAADPASLCGIPLDALRGKLPSRIESNHIAFRGKSPVLISQKRGRDLIFLIPPEDPNISEALSALRHLLTREFQPLRRIIIETINEKESISSPYLPALKENFDITIDIKHVSLYSKVT
jgi:ATP-dependent Lhr-like helicase